MDSNQLINQEFSKLQKNNFFFSPRGKYLVS